MPKVLLTRDQTVDHVFYREGEVDLPQSVIDELSKREGAIGVIGTPPPVVAVSLPNAVTPPINKDVN